MLFVAETLAQAKAHHAAGDWSTAELLYRALDADPVSAEALYLLGETCQALGKLSEAESALRRAVQIRFDYPEAHNALGAVLGRQGKLAEAVTCVHQALALNPAYAEAHYNLATVAVCQNRLDDAAACWRRAVELKPDYAEAYCNLATVAQHQNKLDEAAACYRRAVQLKPGLVDAHQNFAAVLARQERWAEAAGCWRRVVELKPDGVEAHASLAAALVKLERLDEAVASYRRALELKPDYAEVHNNLGAVLSKQGQSREAEACWRTAVKHRPDFAEAHNNLGTLLENQQLFDAAASSYRRAVELKPDFAAAHNNLGAVLDLQGQFDEATACYRRALAAKPTHAEAHHNLGIVLGRQNKFDDALACYERAVELKPDFADAHYNHAATLLQIGRFAEGWREYEWRWKLKDAALTPLEQPRWTGAPLPRGTILLRSEQGSGDELQFVRYAEFVKQRVGRVIVQCKPQLARLMARCAAVDVVVAKGEPLPEFDVWVPLLSLPGIFGTTPDNIPAKVPYLRPAERSIEEWRDELGQEKRFKVGIAWKGNPRNPYERFRCIPLAKFAGIARMPPVCVYSLQLNAGGAELDELANGLPITDLGSRVGDFHNTAAIVCNLDLVISCDSATAHLAGALGMPVWLALPFAAEWRWMLERTDTPWYPTMRLFRQQTSGDWDDVLGRMEQELARIV